MTKILYFITKRCSSNRAPFFVFRNYAIPKIKLIINGWILFLAAEEGLDCENDLYSRH
jgi:hypothetical protein